MGDTDYLAGFTAWGPRYQGIAIARMHWQGDNFTLGGYLVSAVDEYRSDARGVVLRVEDGPPPTRRVRFAIDSPRDLEARLEVFDAMGRRLESLLQGTLPKGSSSVSWDLSTADGTSVPSGVYFARLSFAVPTPQFPASMFASRIACGASRQIISVVLHISPIVKRKAESPCKRPNCARDLDNEPGG